MARVRKIEAFRAKDDEHSGWVLYGKQYVSMQTIYEAIMELKMRGHEDLVLLSPPRVMDLLCSLYPPYGTVHIDGARAVSDISIDEVVVVAPNGDRVVVGHDWVRKGDRWMKRREHEFAREEG